MTISEILEKLIKGKKIQYNKKIKIHYLYKNLQKIIKNILIELKIF